MKNSAIEWTDHTFNPWIGCTKVSPGCAHCYAETRDIRLHQGKHWGKGAPRTRTSAKNWAQVLKWNEEAGENFAFHLSEAPLHDAGDFAPYIRPRVFCASLADWLDDEVPIEWLADLLDLIRQTPNLDWLLLTKRPENWDRRVGAACSWMSPLGPYAETKSWLYKWLGGLDRENHVAPSNVWLGTTVENQEMADKRIPALLSIPAKVRFISGEPLLGAVDLSEACGGAAVSARLDWVICGGESGSHARPMHPDWARSLRDQCQAAGVPFLFKQWGEWYSVKYAGPKARITHIKVNGRKATRYHDWEDGHFALPLGKHSTGRQLDGAEHNQFPEA